VGGGGRHDVDVAVEDQRPRGRVALGGLPRRHDVALAGNLPAERRRALRGAQGVAVERDVDGLQAAVGERRGHDGLAGILVAERRRRLDQAHEEVLHPRLLGADRGEDLLVGHPTEPSRICRVLRSE
jgi:hypothetical protein